MAGSGCRPATLVEEEETKVEIVVCPLFWLSKELSIRFSEFHELLIFGHQ